MMIKGLKKYITAAIKAEQIFHNKKADLEIFLEKYIDFEFFVDYNPSDGLIVGSPINADNAPINQVIALLSEDKKLTYKEYQTVTF